MTMTNDKMSDHKMYVMLWEQASKYLDDMVIFLSRSWQGHVPFRKITISGANLLSFTGARLKPTDDMSMGTTQHHGNPTPLPNKTYKVIKEYHQELLLWTFPCPWPSLEQYIIDLS